MARTKLKASDIQEAARMGFERMRNYRNARAMYLKAYVGQYWQEFEGLTGEEPINMIFRAISAYIPALVMQNPRNIVTTAYSDYELHAQLLKTKLDESQEAMRLKEIYRAWLVDAFFGFGIIYI